MSYCAIITFNGGMPSEAYEFGNAWGGAARIWTSLFDAYLKNPMIPYHTWLTSDCKPLWDLATRADLEVFERAVHASTFDKHFIKNENFKRFASDLRAFVSKYPLTDRVDHLPAWADRIESLECEAVGFYGTSVGENLWMGWDSEKDEPKPTPLSNGLDTYEWIDSICAVTVKPQ